MRMINDILRNVEISFYGILFFLHYLEFSSWALVTIRKAIML